MAMDLEEVCRTCLSKSSTLFSIFDMHQPEMGSVQYATAFLMDFCCIQKTPNSMPSKVCPFCSDEIKRAYAFKMRCERSKIILDRYMQQLERAPKSTKRDYRGEPTAPKTTMSVENCFSEPSCSTSKNGASESQVPSKKARKKITQKRPIMKTQVEVEDHPADVICIDDEKGDSNSTTSTDEKIQEAGKCSTDVECVDDDRENSKDPMPLITSQVTSEDGLDSTNDRNSDTGQDCEISRGDSPISIIFVVEDEQLDYNTSSEEDQISNPAANNGNIDKTWLGEDSTDRKDILDDEQQELELDSLERDSFVCHVCMEVVNGEAELVSHVNSHKVSNQEKCRSSIEEPQIHSNSEGIIGTDEQVTNLISSDEGEPDCFLCPTCDKPIEGNDKYMEHVRNCESDYVIIGNVKVKRKRGYPCDTCGVFCRNKETLVSHVRILHTEGVPMYVCGICFKDFSSSEELLKHRNRQACLKYECNVCKKNFNNSEKYDDHMKECPGLLKNNSSTTEEYACKYCSRVYPNKYFKTKHMRYCTKRRKPRMSDVRNDSNKELLEVRRNYYYNKLEKATGNSHQTWKTINKLLSRPKNDNETGTIDHCIKDSLLSTDHN